MSRILSGSKQQQHQLPTNPDHEIEFDFSKIHSFKTSFDESSSSKDFQVILKGFHMAASGLANKDNPILGQGDPPGAVVISRKRKAWEGGGRAVSNKYVGSGRLPSTRGPDDEEEKGGGGLDTPVCSRTGFEDEGNEGGEVEPGGGSRDEGGAEHHKHTDTTASTAPNTSLLSPMNPNLLNVDDIDTDNLAADFDGSFTGLGVDITTTHYSMSEAMLSLNNIVLNGSQIKQEGGRYTSLKTDPQYLFSNYGALDLSNDEAQHANDGGGGGDETSPPPTGPQTFSGSVSRDNSMDKFKTVNAEKACDGESLISNKLFPLEAKESKADIARKEPGGVQDVGQQASYTPSKVEISTAIQNFEDLDSSFQYVLTAPTSIATKVGEPSLTYINQGQSYELKMKKLGDLSGHYKKKWLRSTIRICFHERRLQYIESEQIAEWARCHPNERILEVDMPLSYGIGEVRQEYDQLNQVSFSWDPTRETGVFIKVHCISTEFTPKKHGGERGVPFRLQVETWSNEARVHAAACILQVFKLKGADRKHKQDREKLQKRSPVEQEKFSQQYECTVLTDLSVDSIYIPPSRGISPIQSDNESVAGGGGAAAGCNPGTSVAGGASCSVITTSKHPQVKASSLPPSTIREDPSSTGAVAAAAAVAAAGRVNWVTPAAPPLDSRSWRRPLPLTANIEATAAWLSYHRYCDHLATFQNCDAQDLLRFTKSELIQILGNVHGIRLHNDLHMRPISPRMVLYIAQKDDAIFNPILLKEVTTLELGKLLASTFKILDKYTIKIIASGPNKIPVRMTDEYLRYQASESAYLVTFLYDESMDMCTAHLEGVTFQHHIS